MFSLTLMAGISTSTHSTTHPPTQPTHQRPIALREVAVVFRFGRTSSTRLLQRLKVRPWSSSIAPPSAPLTFLPSFISFHKTISTAEALPIESTALGALAEASGNDVRACLNALQLFKARIPALLACDAGQRYVCMLPTVWSDPSINQSISLPVPLPPYTILPSHTPNHHSLQGAALSARLSRELLVYIGRGLKDQERDLLQVRELSQTTNNHPSDRKEGRKEGRKDTPLIH